MLHVFLGLFGCFLSSGLWVLGIFGWFIHSCLRVLTLVYIMSIWDGIFSCIAFMILHLLYGSIWLFRASSVHLSGLLCAIWGYCITIVTVFIVLYFSVRVFSFCFGCRLVSF